MNKAETNGLSIIIPTWNEAQRIGALLASLPYSDNRIEVIVVDGGSTDSTQEKLVELKGVLLQCDKGRGQQLATAVKRASRENLWFLHADSKITSHHVEAIFHALEEENLGGGNFAIEFDGKDAFSAWLNRFYRAIRRRGFYYGDSGIFIRKSLLEKLGGVPCKKLMEDYALVRKMEASGMKILCIESPAIISSSRRFRGRSHANIICGWLVIHLMYYLHLPDTWLAKVYNAKLFSPKNLSN